MDFLLNIVRGFVGVAFFIGLAYLFSSNKKKIDWRLVLSGLSLQIILGLLLIGGAQYNGNSEFVRTALSIFPGVFDWVSQRFVVVLGYTTEGSKFIFGDLVYSDSLGFIFAVNVLPTVIFFSTLTAGLYYLGVLQFVVKGIAWVMAKTMRLSGAESLSAAGNIFLGQTEAPLLVKPFVPKMTKSELMCLMTGGMATIAGGVLASYVGMLGGESVEQQAKFASYLLSASVLNAPAAIILSKILIPETDRESVDTSLNVNSETLGVNLIDALANGASEGLKLALNIGGMLLAFIALIAALNGLLGWVGDFSGLNGLIATSTNGNFDSLSMEFLLGQIFRVFAFFMGVDWAESSLVGSLVGTKLVVNEFVAYSGLQEFMGSGVLSKKSIVISTYALCGFANFSSIAIQIGGIGGMAPTQQGNISKLGFKALFAATIATMLTGTIAGAFF